VAKVACLNSHCNIGQGDCFGISTVTPRAPKSINLKRGFLWVFNQQTRPKLALLSCQQHISFVIGMIISILHAACSMRQ